MPKDLTHRQDPKKGFEETEDPRPRSFAPNKHHDPQRPHRDVNNSHREDQESREKQFHLEHGTAPEGSERIPFNLLRPSTPALKEWIVDFELGSFSIGGMISPDSGNRTGDPVVIGGSDLPAHGAIAGVTDSGNTGLRLGILEESLFGTTPFLIIDPKGDVASLSLGFSEFQPGDFRSWKSRSFWRRPTLRWQP